MSEVERCGWCGGEALLLASRTECRGCGAIHARNVWDHRQRVIRLGRELDEAIERGRRLHPWEGLHQQIGAVVREHDELNTELDRYVKDVDVDRVYAEALDTYVCAYRAKEGR